MLSQLNPDPLGSLVAQILISFSKLVWRILPKKRAKYYLRLGGTVGHVRVGQYLDELNDQLEHARSSCSCNEKKYCQHCSVFLTCFVKPTWFWEVQQGSLVPRRDRFRILQSYQNAYHNKKVGRIVRFVILSKRKARRLMRQQARWKKATGKDIIEEFADRKNGANTFECYWCCENTIRKALRGSPPARKMYLFEDFGIFGIKCVVIYVFATNTLATAREGTMLMNMARDLIRYLEKELNEKSECKVVFETFDDMYGACVRGSLLMKVADKVKEILGCVRSQTEETDRS